MRNILASALLFTLFSTLYGAAAESVEAANGEGICGTGLVQDDAGSCLEPSVFFRQTTSALLPASVQNRHSPGGYPFVVYFFWGKGCVHCEKERQFLDRLKNEFPEMEVREFEVWYQQENASRLSDLLQTHNMRVSGVPVTFIGTQVFVGFSERTRNEINDAIHACRVKSCVEPGMARDQNAGTGSAPAARITPTTAPEQQQGTSVDLPLFGRRDARQTSLPVLTIMIAGLDSFNPCAFFVLLSLLGLLVHARSRRKMFLIGGVFVFFSGFIYFLFMAAWLNLFLVMGQVALITTLAGCISVMIGAINIKDFFFFKQGISLTIPDSAKPRLFDRMRKLLHDASLPSLVAGTTVLAIVANSYELLCTAGFPMVFTRILTLHAMSATAYYLYLALYAIVYIIPLFLIVAGMSITLGSRKLTEQQGRTLKLISGTMMLGLGIVLIINPALLNSLVMSVVLLTGAVAVSVSIALVERRLRA